MNDTYLFKTLTINKPRCKFIPYRYQISDNRTIAGITKDGIKTEVSSQQQNKYLKIDLLEVHRRVKSAIANESVVEFKINYSRFGRTVYSQVLALSKQSPPFLFECEKLSEAVFNRDQMASKDYIKVWDSSLGVAAMEIGGIAQYVSMDYQDTKGRGAMGSEKDAIMLDALLFLMDSFSENQPKSGKGKVLASRLNMIGDRIYNWMDCIYETRKERTWRNRGYFYIQKVLCLIATQGKCILDCGLENHIAGDDKHLFNDMKDHIIGISGFVGCKTEKEFLELIDRIKNIEPWMYDLDRSKAFQSSFNKTPNGMSQIMMKMFGNPPEKLEASLSRLVEELMSKNKKRLIIPVDFKEMTSSMMEYLRDAVKIEQFEPFRRAEPNNLDFPLLVEEILDDKYCIVANPRLSSHCFTNKVVSEGNKLSFQNSKLDILAHFGLMIHSIEISIKTHLLELDTRNRRIVLVFSRKQWKDEETEWYVTLIKIEELGAFKVESSSRYLHTDEDCCFAYSFRPYYNYITCIYQKIIKVYLIQNKTSKLTSISFKRTDRHASLPYSMQCVSLPNSRVILSMTLKTKQATKRRGEITETVEKNHHEIFYRQAICTLRLYNLKFN